MAGLADLDTVLPLQCAYEVEEVLAPGMPLRTDASRLILRQQITRGLVTIVQAGAQIIAKAGLNATGSRYAQIGGVYTLPQWRNQGIASQLMKLLVQAMLACGWGGSLFVKTHNTPALRVYRKLGFQEQGSFSVVYF
jgi:predicted GNAT family acetyltransferase